MRSSATRRNSARLSASGDGFRFAASSLARMNRSIGFFTHAASWTVGGSERPRG